MLGERIGCRPFFFAIMQLLGGCFCLSVLLAYRDRLTFYIFSSSHKVQVQYVRTCLLCSAVWRVALPGSIRMVPKMIKWEKKRSVCEREWERWWWWRRREKQRNRTEGKRRWWIFQRVIVLLILKNIQSLWSSSFVAMQQANQRPGKMKQRWKKKEPAVTKCVWGYKTQFSLWIQSLMMAWRRVVD